MTEQIQWKESKVTIRGNQYFHYPQDENEFKNEVVKSGGWIAHIHKNGAFVDKVEADSSVIWQSPIFTHIKTTTINSKDIEQIYENCKIYAVPKGYEDMLPQITQNNLKPKGKNVITNPPLNQILYGPPGTGKTYSTIDRALEILHYYDKSMQIPESREDKKAIFEKYKECGQIAFVTFHQSFSYEEFVEGIKPKLIDSSEVAQSSQMEYQIKSGIFKQLCKNALENLENSLKDTNTLNAENQISNLFEAFIEHIQNEQEQGKEYVLKQNDESDKNWLVEIAPYKNTNYKTIRIFTRNGYLAKWPKFLTPDNIKAYYKDFKADNNFKIPSSGNRKGYIEDYRFYSAFFTKMQEFEATWQDSSEIDLSKAVLKPYILIIDEINRGNIAKILGELITLIEPSKRIGASEELRVTLPYSNETFGVPSNLYIIGTMNTADRSIALLDTALRRRFEFVEMMPNPSLLRTDCEGVDLQSLLQSINARIEFLLDREHTIGHSFFIGVDSMEDLREVFGLKIIPLLQEYFYDDYKKIQAVLNDNQMIQSKPKPDFLGKFNDEIDSEKVVYEITDSNSWDTLTFTKIYQSNDSRESSDNE
ncbi:McrB family protein [Helicobacter sp. T3_23-1059]